MNISLDSSKPSMRDYSTPTPCTWCDNCGDYGIWTATRQALVESGLHPWEVLLCFDVGCHGNGADKIAAYTFHGLHGRVIPFAAGAKLANPRFPVIAFGGDGASFSEGVGHLVHGIRSNYPIVFVLHNNANYGLTTGQASAVTWQEQSMNSSPSGIPERTLRSMDFVFSLEPTFVARSFSGDIPQMTAIFKAAIGHRGFAFVDILQTCPTYNKFATHAYLLERCKPVGDDHDSSNFDRARELAVDTSKSIATGVLYQDENVPNFYERLQSRQGFKTAATEEVTKVDIKQWMRKFV